jgi:hypothetical protein
MRLDPQLLRSNLKATKRSLKQLPDLARVLAAHVNRRSSGESLPTLPLGATFAFDFRTYRPGKTAYPVTVISPPGGHYMTTFFDVSPFSPSGRYVAVTLVPFINRMPIPGDAAQICVIDLQEHTCTAIYQTSGWGAQLGANVQWGSDDDTLFCNDLVDGRGTGIKISRSTGSTKVLGGPIYGVTPDRRYSFSPNIHMVNAIIPGYGVADPLFGRIRQHELASSSEGIWRTDLQTGTSDLFMSLADIVPQLDGQENLAGGKYYVFNTKVNVLGDRLFAVLFSRDVPLRRDRPTQLVTMKLDGSDLRIAMPERLWRLGGHHPNWTPDGHDILMNLRVKGTMAFVRFRSDGSDLAVVAPGHKGSGHPSLNPAQTHLLTDSYISEGFKDADGNVPIRLIELDSNRETEVCRVFTNRLDGPRRIDPHPVWSSAGDKILFNGILEGHRQVCLVDVTDLRAENGR